MSHDPLDHGRRNVVLASGAAVALGLAGRAAAALDSTSKERRMSTLVIRNARITTLDPQQPHAQALAVQEGRIVAVGSDEEIMRGWGNEATLIDAQGRRLLPGLNDSHTHLIRGGLNYNLELRWDGLRSLGDALDMLKAQVDRTPAPQWVRVVGGFTAAQFNEKRLPTLQELNDIAPDTPVFLLHLYDRALLNRAALRACGYSKDTPDPPGGQIVRDSLGNPTGLLLAKPNALILYATLAKGPTCSPRTRARKWTTSAAGARYCSRARAMTCCATTALAKCWCSPRPTSSCSTSRARNCRLSWNRNCTMW